MIHQRVRDRLAPIVGDYRAADRIYGKAARRADKASRDLARDPIRPAFIVENAVARSKMMSASADLAAKRDALKLAQKNGR